MWDAIRGIRHTNSMPMDRGFLSELVPDADAKAFALPHAQLGPRNSIVVCPDRSGGIFATHQIGAPRACEDLEFAYRRTACASYVGCESSGSECSCTGEKRSAVERRSKNFGHGYVTTLGVCDRSWRPCALPTTTHAPHMPPLPADPMDLRAQLKAWDRGGGGSGARRWSPSGPLSIKVIARPTSGGVQSCAGRSPRGIEHAHEGHGIMLSSPHSSTAELCQETGAATCIRGSFACAICVSQAVATTTVSIVINRPTKRPMP